LQLHEESSPSGFRRSLIFADYEEFRMLFKAANRSASPSWALDLHQETFPPSFWIPFSFS
jgi:hypothetical protein